MNVLPARLKRGLCPSWRQLLGQREARCVGLGVYALAHKVRR